MHSQPEQLHRTIADRLLAWYDRNARVLPWRTGPKERRQGILPDPYHVWLSEVMLQQTQVATVRDYFHAFLRRWPSVEDLAAAPEEEVMKAWAGLGYYSRARNLKKCAEAVANAHGGRFPEIAEALRELPGIGEYTAAAISAIAFDAPEVVVDGNVERVVARLLALGVPPRQAKPEIRAYVKTKLPADRPGDFAQAMMDLGATICTPKNPSCMLCPVSSDCAALSQGDPQLYPVSAEKKEKPQRAGAAFVASDGDGAVLLRRRPPSGLLGGMSEVPTTGWTASCDGETDVSAAPFSGGWRKAGTVRHVFTHFALDLTVWHCEVANRPKAEGWWSPVDELPGEALPSVMKKVIEAAIPGATKQKETREIA